MKLITFFLCISFTSITFINAASSSASSSDTTSFPIPRAIRVTSGSKTVPASIATWAHLDEAEVYEPADAQELLKHGTHNHNQLTTAPINFLYPNSPALLVSSRSCEQAKIAANNGRKYALFFSSIEQIPSLTLDNENWPEFRFRNLLTSAVLRQHNSSFGVIGKKSPSWYSKFKHY